MVKKERWKILSGTGETGRVSDCCSWFESDCPLKAGSDDSMSEPLARLLVESPEVLFFWIESPEGSLFWFSGELSRFSSGSDIVSAELLNAEDSWPSTSSLEIV